MTRWPALVLALQAAAAESVCEQCHPRHVAGFRETGMGRSMGARAIARTEWRGQIGATRFQVDGVTQSIERAAIRGTHEASITIGSGNHAIGFLIRTGGFLFQSPLAWYARRGVWDAAPGYENNAHPDFNRPIIAECLFCHANRAAPDAGTLNRYGPGQQIEEPISCARCHGPGDAHAARPSRHNIVNPARLARERRDAVCEQCHLGGEARILNPGKTWHEFAPGQLLEDTFVAYAGSPRGRFKVVSHVEQLALSVCAQKSQGKLWCGTCHDPHSKPAEPVSWYRSRCLACHDQSRHPNTASVRDCAGCHMPKRKAPDSGHAAFTDHRIVRRPSAGAESKPSHLTAWRPAPARWEQRNLGLAYASLGEKEQSVELLAEAGRLLSTLGDPDAETLAALGLVRLLQDRPKEAALLLERAVAARPGWAAYYQKLAIAWNAAGDRGRAIRILNRAIELDPSIEALYHTLAGMERGDSRRDALERYLRFAPQSVTTREALRR